jgi:hypothetical protein
MQNFLDSIFLYLIKIPWISSVSLSSGHAGESSVGTPLLARALQGIKNAQLAPQGSENTYICWQSQMQNLLHYTSRDAKSLGFIGHVGLVYYEPYRYKLIK